MRKALVVTMYYEPLNLVPVRRMSLITNALKKDGFEVDVFTRKYSDHQLNSSSLNVARESCDAEETTLLSKGSVTRVPYSDFNKKLKYSKSLPPGLRGVYNLNQIDVYHYDFEERFRAWFAGKGKYDVVILSYGPPVILSIAIWLRSQTTVRIIVDFRDAYVTEHDSGWIKFFKKRNLRKLASAADGFLFASPGVNTITTSLINQNIPALDVLNGAEPLTEPVSEHDIPIELKACVRIKALHAGSLYPGQDIGYFGRLFDAYNNASEDKIELFLLGLADHRPKLNLDLVRELPKVSFDVSRKVLEFADLLVLPVWKGRYTGYSGKLLEYLYSGKKIICGPEPQQDLKEILDTNPNAYILSGNFHTDVRYLESILKKDLIHIDRQIYGSGEQRKKLVGFIDQIVSKND